MDSMRAASAGVLDNFEFALSSASPQPPLAVLEATAEALDKTDFGFALFLTTMAGMATTIGGLLVVLQHDLNWQKLGLWEGLAAGFMIAVSTVDLLPSVIRETKSTSVSAAMFAFGSLFFVMLKKVLPDPDIIVPLRSFVQLTGGHPMLPMLASGPEAERERASVALRDVLCSGFLTALAISIHNLPEGVAVCVGSLGHQKRARGINLAIGIGFHNIPEGMAVAMPVYFATRSRAAAVGLAFLSGLAEPLGVLVVVMISWLSFSITPAVVSDMLAMVAGIMITISAIELAPSAVKHAGNRIAWMSTALGFVVMCAILYFVDFLEIGSS
mmetsp:Transcript_2654/g.7244  ORF Transcript_2654/g.7244 Transcript_2654/m.7244 type:complete len:328 (-) Transcript_2654:79-1062(-)